MRRLIPTERALSVALLALLALALHGCARERGPESMPRGGHEETGLASWYGPKYHGRTTASGERYNMFDLTAAHRTLPFGTRLRVTNLLNGKQVLVRVNDRGPFVKGRVIDVSYEAAKRLEMTQAGVVRVRVEVLGGGGVS